MKAAFIIVTVTALWLGACIATAVPTPAMSVSCATAAATPPAVREYWIKFLRLKVTAKQRRQAAAHCRKNPNGNLTY
jgi:hypothetical protein